MYVSEQYMNKIISNEYIMEPNTEEFLSYSHIKWVEKLLHRKIYIKNSTQTTKETRDTIFLSFSVFFCLLGLLFHIYCECFSLFRIDRAKKMRSQIVAVLSTKVILFKDP